MRKKGLRKEFLSSALILVGALMLLPVVSNGQTACSDYGACQYGKRSSRWARPQPGSLLMERRSG